MKTIYSIIIFKQSNEHEFISIVSTYNLNQFNYFTRFSIKELLIAGSKEIISRTNGNFGCVNTQKSNQLYKFYYYHYLINKSKYCCVISANDECSQYLITHLINEIIHQSISSNWEQNLNLTKILHQYQNLHDIDPIVRLNNDLEETKTILITSMDALLRRGEQLEDLIEKSEELSITTKKFARESSKLNRCCTIY